MAQAERGTFENLRLETSFGRAHTSGWRSEEEGRGAFDFGDGIEDDQTSSHYFDTPRSGTDEDNSIIKDLHSATPPISVPRHDTSSPARTPEDLSFPHKPDEVQASPLESFIQNRHPFISLHPNASPDNKNQHTLGEDFVKSDVRIRGGKRFQQRSSGLKNSLTHDEAHETNHAFWNSDSTKDQSPRSPARNNQAECAISPDDEQLPANSEAERPTSLTSLSTASPLADELRTPPEGAKGLLSPVLMTSPPQAFPSLGEQNSWSGGSVIPFGSKPRGYRGSRSSRRSTASSGKSPASAFLSMWSCQETREMPAPKPDDEGQMVGTDYVLGKQIGLGGFSVVKEAYKVEEHGEPRMLAVKIVKKQLPERSEQENDEVQAEFDHEVHVWRYLNHPNVLSLDAVYETDYATFCFTKFAIGGTLFDLVRQNRSGIDMNLVRKYAFQLACALRYLHEDARVIHRDIKLENCLLDPVDSPDGRKSSNLILCDFGMAEWMNTDNGPDSPDEYGDSADRPPPKPIGPAGSSTSKAGSLEYASPELLISTDGIISPAVDIWAFGVVVFSMIVGSRPFQDSFQPRVSGNITAGRWSREAVLVGVDDPNVRRDREEALELIQGCLEMNMEKRWTIREIVSSRFLGGFAECLDETVSWRL